MKGFLPLLLPLLTLPTLVWAQGPDPEKEADRPPRLGEVGQRLFAQLDVDQSGDLNTEEFQAHPRLSKASDEQKSRLFQRLDKNNDGLIQRRELRPPRPEDRQERRRRGPMNYEQFAAQPRIKKMSEERKQELFKRLDRNQDGQLSHEDSRRRQRPPRDRDRDRERGPNREAAPFPRRPLEDSNKDGQISFQEFYAHPPHQKLGEDEAEDRFEAIDSNQDGQLSPEELQENVDRPPRKKD